MFIAATGPFAQPSSVGAAWLVTCAPTRGRRRPSKQENMPLLRSLADTAARVAINMALLTELFASLPPLPSA